MKLVAHLFRGLAAVAILIAGAHQGLAAKANEARVTHIVRDVKLLPSSAGVRPAAIDDRIAEDTGVRTGDKSRSELTFADLTITRLGANTVYSYDKAGRGVELGGGSVLLRVPKDSGGGNVRTKAVTVAVTGTTLILETTAAGRNKLIVLEGGARLSLRNVRGQSRSLRAGQMLDVPAGARTLPEPTDIDLDQLMKTHPLITGFRPLPSRDLIAAAGQDQGARPGGEPVFQGRPVSGQPVGFQPTVGIGLPLFPGARNPSRPGGGRAGSRPRPSRPPAKSPNDDDSKGPR